jgi:hypothetical protein
VTSAKNFGLRLLAPARLGRAQETGGTYMNPVSNGSADTFADPSIIKARDGYRYSYGTTEPLRGGGKRTHAVPMVPALQI